MRRARVTLIVIVALLQASSALSQNDQQNWREIKCNRYAESWREAVKRQGLNGISTGFMQAHDQFLKSGCETPAQVCPRSPEELKLANVMVLRAMNAGTASTFLPFSCPR